MFWRMRITQVYNSFCGINNILIMLVLVFSITIQIALIEPCLVKIFLAAYLLVREVNNVVIPHIR